MSSTWSAHTVGRSLSSTGCIIPRTSRAVAGAMICSPGACISIACGRAECCAAPAIRSPVRICTSMGTLVCPAVM